MRKLISLALVAVVVVGVRPDARADVGETTMVITNDGSRPVRVQVALGSVLPCDSHDNAVLLDAHVGPHETRTLGLGLAAVACARSTSPGSDLDWGSSRWLSGGYRCRRARSCVRDTNVLMRLDVGR